MSLVIAVAAWAGPRLVDLGSDPAPYHVGKAKKTVSEGPGRGMARRALLVSIDGIAFPTLQRLLPRLPHLRRLVSKGFLRPMESVFPSMTWSAHASAVTGQYPSVHGILGNRWYQGGRGLVRPYAAQTSDRERMTRAASIYDLAHARGFSTAALNWPGTQFSPTLTYNLPETMYNTELPRRLLSPSLRPMVRRWYRRRLRRGRTVASTWGKELGKTLRAEDLATDRFVTDMALQLLRKERSAIPRLMMVHYIAADLVQHHRGTRSAQIFPTLRRIDRMVGELLRAYRRRGLERETATLIFSDHGFAEIQRTMDLGRLFKQEGLSRYRSLHTSIVRHERVLAVLNGHAAFIYLRDEGVKLREHVTRLLRRPEHRACIEAVYAPHEYHKLGLPVPISIESEAHPGGEARQGEPGVPPGHPGAPQLIALTRPGCSFGLNRTGAVVRKVSKRYGAHGYLPTHRAIRAFLIGAGAGISANAKTLATCRIVDIAPTAARLLDLRWPRVRDADLSESASRLAGRSLDELLRSPPRAFSPSALTRRAAR